MDALAPSLSLNQAFLKDVIDGLSAPTPAVPARWLYDLRGSELFDQITRLPEYYPTRTETALLEAHAPEVALLAGTGQVVVELGAGSATKTPILLRAIDPAAYVPIDISGEYLEDSVGDLHRLFPALLIRPLEGDFMRSIRLPRDLPKRPMLGFFPGSTIGNMVPATAIDLLRSFREALGSGACLLIGMDRRKDVELLVRAYDDAAGLTAAFNLNLLHRINTELDADIDVAAFRHRAVWNDIKSRIEMRLEALRDTSFTIAGHSFSFRAGETIHTENSHKYGVRDSRLLLEAAGWCPCREWTDEAGNFALILAEAEAPRMAP